ncbi:MAG: PQQ-binding-like beta-propeller repeat protein [Kofleriaceae bacterium]|nr:PQQ-binding-like beta-propeller repeat protein [Myxococcales bacterium]MCB9563823.1 PQQ-binding-like beta-propeller repeat protein [Kofleriaceae bacterium]MCB9573576.1 PQQ-binding-like beta-propeller repeat protein [Kofleriaceae bacterium]
MRALTRTAIALVVATLLAACGGAQTFGLTSDDNNRDALTQALGMRQLPAKPGPVNATGKPMVFAVLGGKPRRLVAYDLAAGKAQWTVDADVQSRVAVGGDFVVAREGQQLVARDLADGKVRWQSPLGGDLVGVTADGTRAFAVTASGSGPKNKPVWRLAAYDGASGNELWSADAPGQLGAPAAQGGLVMSPFLKQWLTFLDAATGKPITRVRGLDEEISFVETTSDAAWFGSAFGVFRVDARAASGQRADATYGTTTLPKQLAKATWGADAFDPVQAGYSAADRTRILWRAPGSGGDDGMQFQDGLVAVHYFRFVFGYTPAGELRWAYSHPRVELVASAHLGSVLGAVSQRGEIVALDPATGALRWEGDLGVDKAQVLGATFDADGWQPSGGDAVDPGTTVAALIAIARDRDARFADVKELAISALASLPGKEVSAEIVGIIQDERTPPKLRDTAVEVLISRKDASALDVFADALAVPYDYITGSQPVAVAEVSKAIAGLAGLELDAGARTRATAALVALLESPRTDNPELVEIVKALAAIGDGAEVTPLRRMLMAYRADPMFGGDPKLVGAVVGALLARGGAAREWVAYVAEDPRTLDAVAQVARQALAKK